MCSRFTLDISPQVLAKAFDLKELPTIEPRYNIAPGQQIAVIRHMGDHKKLDLLKWGLHPNGCQDTTHTPINAHCETVHEKSIFVHAVKYNRCIIPTSGFYEWMPNVNHRQPYYIRLSNSGVMGVAGLWERWNAEDGTELETCCILTTSANEKVKPIHDRMPVILQPEDYDFWLNRHMHAPHELQKLYRPYQSDLMTAYPVPELVNNPRFDSHACIVHM